MGKEARAWPGSKPGRFGGGLMLSQQGVGAGSASCVFGLTYWSLGGGGHLSWEDGHSEGPGKALPHFQLTTEFKGLSLSFPAMQTLLFILRMLGFSGNCLCIFYSSVLSVTFFFLRKKGSICILINRRKDLLGFIYVQIRPRVL